MPYQVSHCTPLKDHAGYSYVLHSSFFMHQSFASTPPPTPNEESGGMAGLMSGIITFWMSPQCRVSVGIVISHQTHDRVDLKYSRLMQWSVGR